MANITDTGPFPFENEYSSDHWCNIAQESAVFKLTDPPSGTQLEQIYVVNSHHLAKQILADNRFVKDVAGPLTVVRKRLQALTISASRGRNHWEDAQKSLARQFEPDILLRWAFDGMNDITQQLVLKWERFGPTCDLHLAEDFSCLVLDVLGISIMNWRINSFYRSGHDFATKFNEFVNNSASIDQIKRELWNLDAVHGEDDHRNAEEIVKEFRKGFQDRPTPPLDRPDFLADVLEYRQGALRNRDLGAATSRQIALLFIATVGPTSSLLSSAIYELLKNRPAYEAVQKEVDDVLAGEACAVDQLAKLPYITAVLQETLRLHPPIPALAVRADHEIANIGDYRIPSRSKLLINIQAIQRDGAFWVSEAGEFRPNRMINGVDPDAVFAPFGDSDATYREFAMMLSKLVIASLFQRFNFELVEGQGQPQLRYTQRIELQPVGLRIRAKPRRSGAEPPDLPQGPPMYILWGGRDGTCENYAEMLARWAPAKGYKPVMAELNGYAGRGLPTNGPIIIIAATYHGQPTANAKAFYDELEGVTDMTKYDGVNYAVFGCGRSGWTGNFQKAPTRLDQWLNEKGATQIIERGEFDAARPITADAFDDWRKKLWKALEGKYHNHPSNNALYREAYEMRKIGHGDARYRIMRQRKTISAFVVENKIISQPVKGLPTRHLELKMNSGQNLEYQPGDVISILPTNSFENVQRVFRHFGIGWEQDFCADKLSNSAFNPLPSGQRVKLFELLFNYVEVGKPAQRTHLEALIRHTENDDTQRELQSEINTRLSNTIRNHMSILDYLEKHPDIKLPFNEFFVMLPHMRTREYSISSSARWKPDSVTLSYQEHTKGVSSSYLARLSRGDALRFTYRKSSDEHFGLPERLPEAGPGDPQPPPEAGLGDPQPPPDPAGTIIVMFATGTGVAPFRAMIQDRWVRSRREERVGKMILFVGCRDPTIDYLYADSDFKEWGEQGILDLRPAFSQTQEPDALRASMNCKHVQDRVEHDKDEIKDWFKRGARFLTCGSVAASNGLLKVGIKIVKEAYQERLAPEGQVNNEVANNGRFSPAQIAQGTISDEEAKQFILHSQKYFTDVFG